MVAGIRLIGAPCLGDPRPLETIWTDLGTVGAHLGLLLGFLGLEGSRLGGGSYSLKPMTDVAREGSALGGVLGTYYLLSNCIYQPDIASSSGGILIILGW